MKKVAQTLLIAVCTLPIFAYAETPSTTTLDKVQAAQGTTTAQVNIQDQTTTLISPRTGIRYTLGNTGNRPIILKTEAIAVANSASVKRIVASNPALSVASQEKAQQALLGTVPAPAATTN